jgi:hypothetical protein
MTSPGRRRGPAPLPVAPAAPQPAPARGRPRASGYIVRASELGQFSYCRRAWWLRYVRGAEPGPAGQARLAGGHATHAAHGRGVWLAGALWRFGLIAAALLAAGALLWLIAALLAH